MHDRKPDCHTLFIGFDACMTSQLNVDLICKLRGPLKCLAYFLDVPFMFVCTTSHWQTFNRLVQELNVCTVPLLELVFALEGMLFLLLEKIGISQGELVDEV